MLTKIQVVELVHPLPRISSIPRTPSDFPRVSFPSLTHGGNGFSKTEHFDKATSKNAMAFFVPTASSELFDTSKKGLK